MSYCIAFSIDGATDVSRRYVRNAATNGLERTRAPEEVLLWVVGEIRRMRRERLSVEERQVLVQEDEREERELQSYVAEAIATDVTNMIPGLAPAANNNDSDDHKVPTAAAPAGRQSGKSFSSRRPVGHDSLTDMLQALLNGFVRGARVAMDRLVKAIERLQVEHNRIRIVCRRRVPERVESIERNITSRHCPGFTRSHVHPYHEHPP